MFPRCFLCTDAGVSLKSAIKEDVKKNKLESDPRKAIGYMRKVGPYGANTGML